MTFRIRNKASGAKAAEHTDLSGCACPVIITAEQAGIKTALPGLSVFRPRGIDSFRIFATIVYMETLYGIMTETLGSWSGEVLGRPLSARLSRSALLSSPEFVREDAGRAAALLGERMEECRLLGVPMLKSVTERNGWILFDLDSAAFDAYALSLPKIRPGEMLASQGVSYVDYRMDMLLRHPDAPVPDREPVKRAVLTASRACGRGKWTPQDERTVLNMTHGFVSFDRLKTEQACSRVARIILCERAGMREADRQQLGQHRRRT